MSEQAIWIDIGQEQRYHGGPARRHVEGCWSLKPWSPEKVRLATAEEMRSVPPCQHCDPGMPAPSTKHDMCLRCFQIRSANGTCACTG